MSRGTVMPSCDSKATVSVLCTCPLRRRPLRCRRSDAVLLFAAAASPPRRRAGRPSGGAGRRRPPRRRVDRRVARRAEGRLRGAVAASAHVGAARVHRRGHDAKVCGSVCGRADNGVERRQGSADAGVDLDEKAPCLLSGLTEEAVLRKEQTLLSEAIAVLQGRWAERGRRHSALRAPVGGAQPLAL